MTCTKRPHSVWTTCACPDCQTTRRRRTKLARFGRYRRVPSDVAVALIDDWTRQGYSPKWIATAAGLTTNYIQNVVSERRHGTNRGIGPAYAARIASTDITTGSSGVGPALGARRRLQALAAIGWTVEELGARSGVKFTTISAIQRGATRQITAARHATVTALWDDLSATRGPSKEAARRAAAKGWHAPAAWDDIDDPHEQPQRACSDPDCTKGAIARGLCHAHYEVASGRRTSTGHAVIDEDSLRDFASWGLTVAQVAERTGVQRDSVAARLRRIGDPDLTARFARNDAAWETAA